ncbi:type II toxin-antitoxin system Phd/YefM family antitoxin [Reyranella sp.]|uniref:type II toxin-antitoxin system Phd/YefM family antitoxin n=1 Tax=Reyranella sp. TaxID=1929291 RepID=UPI003BABEED3
MQKVSITEAKNNLSKLIDSLASGSSVLIVDRGRPVARLEPVTSGVAPDERLARLVRAGIVRPRSAKPARSALSSPPPQAKAGASALAALLDERREGR